MFADLRELVYRANVELAASGLVMGTFGNVSAVDRGAGVMVIKPSGVPYRELTAQMNRLSSVQSQLGEVRAAIRRLSGGTK